ncbi:TatD-related deoxyribonuclease [Methanocaldococcus infernus ME]|uniref:TatD-related deoxyribonuclease n=1 Tax=Methanocaldococcus infernus (strain DSM 11812 / JCM 15783 / ME) TaxID=573063 RepID=D5VRA0_METIM|nr:TatD family hydrolase [Methanocaldococcus infernus]ADG13103.1 TatD-related deoxyribonuclease [Methanocaldococcus infernus ME]
MIITDNHAHVDNERGLGAIKVAKTFYNAGGRVLILLNKPTFDGNLTESMDILVKDIEKINKETKVKAFGLVGVHPAEITYLNQYMPLEKVKEKVIEAIDYASSLVESYDFLVGLGEVGRPHYQVPKEIIEVSNEILKYCMEKAKELDCSIQIHAEASSEEQFKEFSEMAKSVNLDPERVIKHHCGDMVLEGEKYKIFPSILANRVNEELIKKSLRFVMETDYIDDLKRPGVVLGIKTVPRVTKKLLQKGVLDEEKVYRIHKDNIERIYKIELEV